MNFVSVTVFRARKRLLSNVVVEFDASQTLSDVYNKSVRMHSHHLGQEELEMLADDKVLDDKVLLEDPRSNFSNSASLSTSASAITFFKASNATYYVHVSAEAATQGQMINIAVLADMMENAQSELTLPKQWQAKEGSYPLTKKQLLYNSIIQDLDQRDLGWRAAIVESTGKKHCQQLCDILWYISPYHGRFIERSTKEQHKVLLQECVVSQSRNANNWAAKGRKCPDIELIQLKAHTDQLFTLIGRPYMNEPKWQPYFTSLRQLAILLQVQVKFLKTKQETTAASRAKEPIHVPGKDDYLQTRDAVPGGRDAIHSMFYPLEDLLFEAGEMQPICLNDTTLPEDARTRHTYTQQLNLSFPIKLFSYYRGGGAPQLWWAFTFEKDTPEEDVLTLVEKLRRSVPGRVHRAKLKEFHDTFGNLDKISKGLRKKMYEFATGAKCTQQTSKQRGFDARMDTLITLGDPDIIADYRKVKGDVKGSTVFQKYWDEVDKYLEEQLLKVCEDRRHDTLDRLASAVSMRNLHQVISDRLPERTAIPSFEWFRLQFFPGDIRALSHMRHKGKFPMRLKLQSRTLRKSHEDDLYGRESLNNMKELAVFLKKYCRLIFSDDKTKIPVGEPSEPVAATQHTRQAPALLDQVYKALDHGTSFFNLTPSVNLIADIPDSPTESFVRGKVFITVKDSTFQPSSAIRHAVELHRALTDTGAFDDPNFGVLLKYHDGGPDHNDTHPLVQLANIIEFLKTNVDLYTSERCIPGHSWNNPAERVMSILNLALQIVSLDRCKCSPQVEAVLSKCGSMKAVRAAAELNPHLKVKEEVLQSLLPTMQLVGMKFEDMDLHGEAFSVLPAASEEAIDEYFKAIEAIDDTIQQDDVCKQLFSSSDKLTAFMDHCCKSSTCMFQLRKCGNPNCTVLGCNPLKLPLDVFQKYCHFKPHPMLKKSDGMETEVEGDEGEDGGTPYQDFMHNYLNDVETDESCRPVYINKPGKQQDDKNSEFLNKDRSKMWVQCGLCKKPRVVFAKVKMSNDLADRVTAALEESIDYTCGTPSLACADDPTIDEVVCMRANLTCRDPVEFQYYTKQNAPVCCHCGCTPSTDEPFPDIPEDVTNRYREVLVMCKECSDAGKEYVTKYQRKKQSQELLRKKKQAASTQRRRRHKMRKEGRLPPNVQDQPSNGASNSGAEGDGAADASNSGAAASGTAGASNSGAEGDATAGASSSGEQLIGRGSKRCSTSEPSGATAAKKRAASNAAMAKEKCKPGSKVWLPGAWWATTPLPTGVRGWEGRIIKRHKSHNSVFVSLVDGVDPHWEGWVKCEVLVKQCEIEELTEEEGQLLLLQQVEEQGEGEQEDAEQREEEEEQREEEEEEGEESEDGTEYVDTEHEESDDGTVGLDSDEDEEEDDVFMDDVD